MGDQQRGHERGPLTLLQRFENHLEAFIALGGFEPSHYDQQVTFLVNSHIVAAKSHGREYGFRPSRHSGWAAIKPPHIAITGVCLGRRAKHLDPFFRYQLFVFPFPVTQEQIPEPGLVSGAYEHASAPVPAADAPAIDPPIIRRHRS